ncbi:hypothetical protein [Deinococcus yavapaiensis]|uniref:Uncharacterized protein n=1 Tax=Deinococcus yavapaiensis KR-236 TaxID=694435 RepID=A0A318S9K1_9DEIO|nr:hypothetical protein [Deinococcus yavapaiensis]PYE55405.1 hypothetical protein DES52_103238 [Deinococcus yavapaiensis KR-236]
MEEDSGAQLIGSDGRVYVLRVWYEGQTGVRQWRASIRIGTNGERRHFATIDDCIEHLYGELSKR